MLRQKNMHLSCLIPFLYEKKRVNLVSNTVIVQIVISITSRRQVPGFMW